MEPVRILVVEDSITVRKRIVEIIHTTSGLEVIGEASDGRSAIELCERLKPDVISMDIMLPVMSGLAATEYIMAHCPTPILIVSSATNRGEQFHACDALAAGAADVLEKPTGYGYDEESWARELTRSLRVLSRVRVISRRRAQFDAPGAGERQAAPGPPEPADFADGVGAPRVIAIGASTGGPGALARIMSALPASFPIPILVVIHIADAFADALARWVGAQTGLPVRLPRSHEPLDPGGRPTVVIAPPGHHLELQGGMLRLTDGPPRHSCKPSVDVLFESLARELGNRTVACLLTGMGRDGADGLLAIRRAGGLTIAQDEATSVVWGMPGEAVSLGAARHVLPISEIGRRLAAVERAHAWRAERRS